MLNGRMTDKRFLQNDLIGRMIVAIAILQQLFHRLLMCLSKISKSLWMFKNSANSCIIVTYGCLSFASTSEAAFCCISSIFLFSIIQ